MRRRRSTLADRAAAIFAQRMPRRRQHTFVEAALLAEIERALASQQRDVLAALDRLREAAGLPQDPRVAFELKIERLKIELLSPRKGAAA
jgi:hypothetical protein